jgi:DNA-binding Xre family transcriptional regulator
MRNLRLDKNACSVYTGCEVTYSIYGALMIRLKVAEVARTRGLSLVGLQRASGLSITTTRRYWNNQVQRVTLMSLEALARTLNVDIVDLFEKVGSQSVERAS